MIGKTNVGKQQRQKAVIDQRTENESVDFQLENGKIQHVGKSKVRIHEPRNEVGNKLRGENVSRHKGSLFHKTVIGGEHRVGGRRLRRR